MEDTAPAGINLRGTPQSRYSNATRQKFGVIDGGYSPAYVADQLDVPLAAIYGAMAYYYENIEQIRAFEREHADAFERVREDSLKPKESIS